MFVAANKDKQKKVVIPFFFAAQEVEANKKFATLRSCVRRVTMHDL